MTEQAVNDRLSRLEEWKNAMEIQAAVWTREKTYLDTRFIELQESMKGLSREIAAIRGFFMKIILALIIASILGLFGLIFSGMFSTHNPIM